MYIITGSGTCSASESIINSLRGVGVTVYQIGSTTCGKPYGFYPTDNCGTTYFSIQFRGENAANFGDYTDGFSPANTTANIGTSVPGCSVADDFTHALFDPTEARIAAALSFRASNNQACPAASGASDPRLTKASFQTAPDRKPVGLEAGGTHESHRAQKLNNHAARFPTRPNGSSKKALRRLFLFPSN